MPNKIWRQSELDSINVGKCIIQHLDITTTD
jgi:hypothetical protein